MAPLASAASPEPGRVPRAARRPSAGGRLGAGLGAGLVAALVAALVAFAAPAAARAAGPPDPGTGWLEMRTGVVFGTTVASDLLIDDTTRDAAPSFAVSALYRTPRIDLGVALEQLGGAGFRAFEQRRRLSGQVRAAAVLRWRYVEDAWGALYTRLTPGWMGFPHSQGVRQLAADAAGDDLPAGAADRRTSGFSIGAALGVVVYVAPRVALQVEFEAVTGFTTLRAADEDFFMAVSRSQVAAGVAWRM